MESSPDAIKLMLAHLCIADLSDAALPKKVQRLDRFGLTDSEIARVTGAGLQSVRNARQANKRKPKK